MLLAWMIRSYLKSAREKKKKIKLHKRGNLNSSRTCQITEDLIFESRAEGSLTNRGERNGTPKVKVKTFFPVLRSYEANTDKK